MTDRLARWVEAHAVKAIVGAFILGGAWAALTAAVSGKVDKTEFYEYIQQRSTVDSAVLRDVRSIRGLLCQDRPLDSWCARP